MKKGKKFLAVLALCATCGVAATGCSLSDANSEEVTKVVDNATDRISSILERQLLEIKEQEARIILANAATNSALQTKIQVDTNIKYFADFSFAEPVNETIQQIQITEESGNIQAYTKAKIFFESLSGPHYSNKPRGKYENFEMYNVYIGENCYTIDTIENVYFSGYASLESGSLYYEFYKIYEEEVTISGERKDNVITIYLNDLKDREFTTITIENNLITSITITMNKKVDGGELFYHDYNNIQQTQEYKYGDSVATPNFPTSLDGYTKRADNIE